jgi:hypothetical protein
MRKGVEANNSTEIKKIHMEEHGIIPCMCILADHHIERSGQCPVCDRGVEDLTDMLFKCRGAKEIWKKLGLKEVIKSALQIDQAGSAVLDFLLATSGGWVPGLGALPIHQIIATTAWFIWWHREGD